MAGDTVFLGGLIFFIGGGILWLLAGRIQQSSLSPKTRQILLTLVVIAVAGLAILVIDRHAAEYKENYVNTQQSGQTSTD